MLWHRGRPNKLVVLQIDSLDRSLLQWSLRHPKHRLQPLLRHPPLLRWLNDVGKTPLISPPLHPSPIPPLLPPIAQTMMKKNQLGTREHPMLLELSFMVKFDHRFRRRPHLKADQLGGQVILLILQHLVDIIKTATTIYTIPRHPLRLHLRRRKIIRDRLLRSPPFHRDHSHHLWMSSYLIHAVRTRASEQSELPNGSDCGLRTIFLFF